RRRIPAHALAVKKYRCGRSPVSKISDNEHTAPSLWDSSREAACSHELSVKDSVGPPIPEFAQATEEGTKIPSLVARQDAGHILPDHPAGPIAVSNGKIGEREVAT